MLSIGQAIHTIPFLARTTAPPWSQKELPYGGDWTFLPLTGLSVKHARFVS